MKKDFPYRIIFLLVALVLSFVLFLTTGGYIVFSGICFVLMFMLEIMLWNYLEYGVFGLWISKVSQRKLRNER